MNSLSLHSSDDPQRYKLIYHMGLRSVLWYLFALLIFLTLMVLFVRPFERQNAHQQQLESVRRVADLTESDIQAIIGDLASITFLDDISFQDNENLILAYLQNNRQIIDIFFVDQSGEVLAYYINDPYPTFIEEYPLTPSDWVDYVEQTPNYLGPVNFTEDNLPYIHIATAANNNAVIGVRYSLSSIWIILESLWRSQSRTGYLLSVDNQIIVHEDDNLIGHSLSDDVYSSMSITDEDNGYIFENDDGDEFIASGIVINDTEWLIVSQTPMDVVHNISNQMMLWGAFIITIISVIANWSAIHFLDRHFIRPLETMRESLANESTKGVDVPATSVAEIAELVSTYNESLGFVKTPLPEEKVVSDSSFRQLQQAYQELEARYQKMIKSRRNAEQNNRRKTEFLADMSHEIRTPLNAIIGYTDLQLSGIQGDIDDEQRNYLERVMQNAKYLLNMVNSILDISKIEAGKLELASDEVVLEDLAKSVVFQLSGLAQTKNIELTLDYDYQLPSIIQADGHRLKQIMVNLVSNAIKFTDEGSVELRVQPLGDTHWTLSVIDTGIGIPEEDQALVFEAFRQAKLTRDHEEQGTGLGLAIVKQLVDLMNGSISLQSEVGKGTTFLITLPLN